MKKTLCVAALFAISSLALFAANPISEWTFEKPGSESSVKVWSRPCIKNEVSVKQVPGTAGETFGVLAIKVTSNDADSLADLQLIVTKAYDFVPESTYVVTIIYSGTFNANLPSKTMLNQNPWTCFNDGTLSVASGKWRTAKLEFKVSKPVNYLRIVDAFLATMQDGDQLYIKSITLEQK